MIVHWDVEQRTEAWHQLRYGKVCGTDSKRLFAKSNDLEMELLASRLEEFTPERDGYINDAMQRGIDLEPFALMALKRYAKIDFKVPGWIQSDIGILGISPDGLSDCERYAAEIKCLGKKNHTICVLTQQIPLDYVYQCAHYFTVNPKLESLFFESFRPESSNNIFVKEVTRGTELNFGTEARPVIKSIAEVSESAKEIAKEIEEKVEANLRLLEDRI